MPARQSLPFLESLGRQPLDLFGRAALAPERLTTMAGASADEAPYEVVHRENTVRLRRYRQSGPPGPPVVVVYSLINRPTVLDLQPDRSVVRRFLEAGFDVYLVDWGAPSLLDASLTIDDYVRRYLDGCVDAVRERRGVDSVTVLGYCMGGTLSAIYAALRPEKVRALALLAAGLDFADDGGLLARWGTEAHFDEGEVPDAFGNVPAEFLDAGFVAMEPVDNAVTKYVRLWDRLDDEAFVTLFARVERWLRDGVDVAGATYREFVNDLYQHNQLAENELVLAGSDTPVDIGNVEMPVLQVVGARDHLVPPATSVPFNDRIPSDDTAVFELDSGHVGLTMSETAHEDLWPRICAWVHERAGEETAAADGT